MTAPYATGSSRYYGLRHAETGTSHRVRSSVGAVLCEKDDGAMCKSGALWRG